MSFFKKHFSLLLALAIPVAMIVFVAGSIYLPGLFIQPHFSFAYTITTDAHYEAGVEQKSEEQWYVYDIDGKKSRTVTPEVAAQLTLDTSRVSPDGFTIECGNREESFLFFFGSYRDCQKQYLTGHGAHQKIDVPFYDSYYYNFHFKGWIIESND